MGTAHALKASVYATLALALVAPESASSKKITGSVSLGPGQAKVVAKFCFDFKPGCLDSRTCLEPPGRADFDVFDGRDVGGSSASATSSGAGVVAGKKVAEPQVFIAMLDDEYFSFPEVSQVWGEANCSDVSRSAKKTFPLSWKEISTTKGQAITSVVVEKIRPRWWFIAMVSCSDHSLELGYRMHLENLLQGSNSQLSMDEIGIVWICCLVFLTFAGLGVLHVHSSVKWAERRSGAPAGHSLLAASVLFAVLGELCWLSFFRQYKATGETPVSLAVLARACVVIAKTSLQILLMLLAQGECVCTPGISWARQREMVAGMTGFGCLGFILELWGDREASGSPIEYIYDTRPGVALVALEMMWLYAYSSRCYHTWSNETRTRPRHFYKRYASGLSLWFVSLPVVAMLASVLAPWVRFRITFAVSSLAHAAVTGVLVYVFHPAVASDLFELAAKDREAAKNKSELDSFLHGPEDDDGDMAAFGTF